MMPHCDLCAAHRKRVPAPYFRQLGPWMKNLCLSHERARRRLVIFRQREAKAVERNAIVAFVPATMQIVPNPLQ